PKRLQTHPDLAYLALPRRLQLGIGEYLADDRGAMIGGHRVDAARDVRCVARDALRVVAAFRDDADRTHALTVEPEVLRAARHDDHFRKLLAHQPHAVGILFDPLREPLIGEIDEGHDAPPTADFRESAPLLGREIRAARVVAASVQ